ncbi:MAG: alpha/beta fold hydrolase [Solirubrobacterales bacterium]
MSGGAKVGVALLAAVAVLLGVNTLVLGNQTKGSGVTIDGGRILELPGGDAQVFEQGPTLRIRAGAPIVLIHGYAASLHWWDRLAPLLARRHRVVRIDLLGHGGSEKPSSGYSIPEQAAIVAAALDQLEVQGAVVVGHSMGFSVSVALAERASQLVDRLVNIDEGPNQDHCDLPFPADLAYWPVIGEALWRITPNFALRDGYQSAFAPDYEIDSGFNEADQVITDHDAMTFTSFADAADANEDYQEEVSLDERLQQATVPLLSIFGSEDRICDARRSQAAYENVPGARLETIRRAGHSPNVEKPAETARLIEQFALEADVRLRKPSSSRTQADRRRERT